MASSSPTSGRLRDGEFRHSTRQLSGAALATPDQAAVPRPPGGRHNFIADTSGERGIMSDVLE